MAEKPRRPTGRDTAPEISVEPLRYDAGDVVGEKVLLIELLGAGGMGTVWRARHIALDVDVAVKLLHGDLVSVEASERLQREAHAAARIEHPAAVRILDFGRTELGDSYIVMELLRGESLAEFFDRRGPLDAGEAVALLLPIVAVLAAAHARGIVHRDLKPENVMLVDVDGLTVPKLVDFGIATIDGPAITSGDDAIYGSPEYMSPEHARGDDAAIDARSDVWSLGVLLYEAIAGRRPFEHSDPLEVLRSIAQKSFESLAQIGRGDAELSAVVSRALEKDPAARWPDMRSFGRALSQWALDHGIDADVTGGAIAAHWGHASRVPPPPMPPESRRAPPPLPPDNPGRLRKLLAERDEAGVPAERAIAAAATPSSARWWPVAAMIVVGLGLGVSVVQWRSSASAPPPGAESSHRAAPSERQLPASTRSVGASSVPGPSTAASERAIATAGPVASARRDPSPGDTPACVASLFPEDSFQPATLFLGLCAERDAVRGAQGLHVEIARHGLIANRTTEAMRLWAALHWYELPTFAVAQAACCPARTAAPLATPPPPASCEPLGPVLDSIARTLRQGGDVDAAVVAFRSATTCHEVAARRNPAAFESLVRYGAAADGGAEIAFFKIARKAIDLP